MNGFERQKHGLQLAQVQPERVQNLGKDLMGLFGAVSTGAETYAKLGEEAATIDARDKILNATNEITLLKQELVKYEEANDTQGILNVKAGINSIVASVKSYGDEEDGEYKNNIPARNRFNSLVDEWGANTLSTWMPTLDQKWIGAYKGKKVEDVELVRSSFANADMAVPESIIESLSAEMKKTGIGEKFLQETLSPLRQHNLDNLAGELSANPLHIAPLVIKDNQMLPARQGKENIISKYFPAFTLNENGNVIPKDGTVASQTDVVAIEKMIGSIYGTFTKDNDVHDFKFESLLDSANSLFSSAKGGNTNHNEVKKAIESLTEYGNKNSSLLGKSQIKKFMQSKSDMDLYYERARPIQSSIHAAVNNKNFVNLQVMMTRGSNGLSSEEVNGVYKQVMKKESENAAVLINGGKIQEGTQKLADIAITSTALNTEVPDMAKRVMEISNDFRNATNLQEILVGVEFRKHYTKTGEDKAADNFKAEGLSDRVTSVTNQPNFQNLSGPEQLKLVKDTITNFQQSSEIANTKVYLSNKNFMNAYSAELIPMLEGWFEVAGTPTRVYLPTEINDHIAKAATKNNINLSTATDEEKEELVKKVVSNNFTKLRLAHQKVFLAPSLRKSDGKNVEEEATSKAILHDLQKTVSDKLTNFNDLVQLEWIEHTDAVTGKTGFTFLYHVNLNGTTAIYTSNKIISGDSAAAGLEDVKLENEERKNTKEESRTSYMDKAGGFFEGVGDTFIPSLISKNYKDASRNLKEDK